MYKSYSMELAGRTLTVDINRVAKQANGAALMHYGDTTVLSTATASKEPREGIDFFPLSVEYSGYYFFKSFCEFLPSPNQDRYSCIRRQFSNLHGITMSH